MLATIWWTEYSQTEYVSKLKFIFGKGKMGVWLAVKVMCGLISRFLPKSYQMKDTNIFGNLAFLLTVVGEKEKMKKKIFFLTDWPTFHFEFVGSTKNQLGAIW